ncbi:hypothetical protein HDV01_002907 [Terramyces sp. JEL0728]|nr:hypothetical protein HDV01_002907 [Terramyces sp. JEL0728]
MKLKHGKVALRFKAVIIKNVINFVLGIVGIASIFLAFLTTGDLASIAAVLGEAIFGNQVSLLVDTFKIVAKIPMGDTKVHPDKETTTGSHKIVISQDDEDIADQPKEDPLNKNELDSSVSKPEPVAGSPNSGRYPQIATPEPHEHTMPHKLPPLPAESQKLLKKKSLHQAIVERKLSEIHSEISSAKSRDSITPKDNEN